MALNLPTLSEMNTEPRSYPKAAIVTMKKAKRLRDRQGRHADTQWRNQVWARDQHQCQCCHVPVQRVEDEIPWRGECHHIKSRRVKVVRTDVRNGLLLCQRCHADVTAARILIQQATSLMFVAKDGERYINGGKPLRFKRSA